MYIHNAGCTIKINLLITNTDYTLNSTNFTTDVCKTNIVLKNKQQPLNYQLLGHNLAALNDFADAKSFLSH